MVIFQHTTTKELPKRRKTRLVSKVDVMTRFLQLAAPGGLLEGLSPLHPSAALTAHKSLQPSFSRGSECRPTKRQKNTCTSPAVRKT